MLAERRITSVSYDRATDTLSVKVDGAAPAVPPSATALVSAARKLVGLDLRDASGKGEVLMLGEHEDVASTHEVALETSPLGIRHASKVLAV